MKNTPNRIVIRSFGPNAKPGREITKEEADRLFGHLEFLDPHEVLRKLRESVKENPPERGSE